MVESDIKISLHDDSVDKFSRVSLHFKNPTVARFFENILFPFKGFKNDVQKLYIALLLVL